MAQCRYCGECEEEADRLQHHECCPNHYPFEECKALALADWQAGFDHSTNLEAPNADTTFRSPVFQLGYRMKRPGSKLGL